MSGGGGARASKYFLSPALLRHGVGDDEGAAAVFGKLEAPARAAGLSDADKRRLLGGRLGRANDENADATNDAHDPARPRSEAHRSRRVTASPMSASSESEASLPTPNKKRAKATQGAKAKAKLPKREKFNYLDSSSDSGSSDSSEGGFSKIVRTSDGGKKLVRRNRKFVKGSGEPPKRRAKKKLLLRPGRAKASKPSKSKHKARAAVDLRNSDVEDSDVEIVKSDADEDEDALEAIERRAAEVMDAASSSESESDSASSSNHNDNDNSKMADDDVNDESVSGDESDSEHREVQAMFHNCEAISKRLAQSVRKMNLDGKTTEGEDEEEEAKKMNLVTRQDADKLFPEGFALKDYQLVGLNWLRLLYSQDLNGILADEMGLGKTVQAIAILAWLQKTQNIAGPHLVVAPGSTLENWRREVQRWIPWARVEVYHGPQGTRNEIVHRLEGGARKNPKVDVLITTYTYFERDTSVADRAFLSKFNFEYIIYDEAHGLKNMNSARYRRLVRLSCRRRLLLSGTPVQNNLQELLALMSFCMPKVFNASSERLNEYFGDADNSGAAQIVRIRDAMRPFVLRRLKADVLGQLSAKIEDVQLLEMADVQRNVYTDIIAAYRRKKLDAAAGKKRTRAIDSATTHFFSQLRKAANHPLLVRQYFGKTADESPDGVGRPLARFVELCDRVKAFGPAATLRMIEKEIKSYSDWDFHLVTLEYGSRNAELRGMALPQDALWTSQKALRLRELLPKLKAEGHRFLIFSQWTTLLDIIEEMLGSMRIDFVRFDGSTAVGARQAIIDKYNTDMSISACLLSTRAGGMGINLTSADTVILHDLDWSHATDRQAEDRCHRIGQTKPVRIIKLVTRDTVDQNILQIQTRKKHLEAALLISTSGSSSQQTQANVSQDAADEAAGGADAELDAALANDLDPISIIMNRL